MQNQPLIGSLPDSVAYGKIDIETNKSPYVNESLKFQEANYETLGWFLYDPHFLNQIPVMGYYLSQV